jgi:sialic acid synthase SpsE
MQSNRVYVIAEAGVNHNGEISLAKKLIEVAKNCGADAVKFQTFSADNLTLKKTPKVRYQKLNSPKNESYYEMLKRLEFNQEQNLELIKHCKIKKINFLSTPSDVHSAKFLASSGIKKFKIASADITDYFLHKYLSSCAEEVIISTGMSTLKEISDALSLYNNKKTKITLLHCTSNYPCSDKSLNLRVIETLSKKFNLPVGYSDHSSNILTPVVAVSLGSRIIERHITLNKKMLGPDHFASDSPAEFKLYVKRIRNSEIILGSKNKKIQQEEFDMRSISRKGIYYAQDFFKGKKISETDLKLIRPWTKNSIFSIKNIVNNILNKQVYKNQPINKNDFKKK